MFFTTYVAKSTLTNGEKLISYHIYVICFTSNKYIVCKDLKIKNKKILLISITKIQVRGNMNWSLEY